MVFIRSSFAMVLIASLAASGASAYEINPLKNKYHGNRPEGGFWEQITQTVHEDITDAAVSCAENAPEILVGPLCATELPALQRPPTGNKYNALIRGVWWNDDPNQRLFAYHYPTWVAWMDDAHKIATTGHNWRGEAASLNSTYKMQYRSHYGDMQFLHAMSATDGESPGEVRRRIIDWIGFAYQVATGQIEPDTKMADVQSPIASAYFEKQPGWSVNYLFAPTYTLGKSTIPEVALGSILHLIQDSFSEAHVSRAYDVSPGCPSGRVVQFYAYGHQNPKRHRVADTRARWKGNAAFTIGMNPVETSARMLVFAKQRADWTTVVQPYLKSQLFCIGPDAIPSGPGDFS